MQPTEEYYKIKFDEIRSVLREISKLLRNVDSGRVMIQPFCDILWMYGVVETYFT